MCCRATPLLRLGSARSSRWPAHPAAQFLVAALIELQDAPVDVCNFYHGETGVFGLFTEVGLPTRNYYGLLAFSQLLETPQRLRVTGGVPGKLAVAAGICGDRTQAAVLVANMSGTEDLRVSWSPPPWVGDTRVDVRIVDQQRGLELLVDPVHTDSELILKLRSPSVALVTLRAAE